VGRPRWSEGGDGGREKAIKTGRRREEREEKRREKRKTEEKKRGH